MGGKRALVLLVDDRSHSRDLVRDELLEAGLEVVTASDGEEGWQRFLQHTFDLVITDLRMPRLDGIGLLRLIRSEESPNPEVPVILLTAYGSLSIATAAGKAGATDCFPFNGSGVAELIARARALLEDGSHELPDVLRGESPAIVALRERLAAVARLQTAVLISGEPGTGRGAVVAHLHRLSQFSLEPLVRIKCGSAAAVEPLPERGMVLLDDVEELPGEAQCVWRDRLRGLDRLGLESPVRVVASTTSDLRRLVGEGSFDAELNRRISQFEVRLPALRERIEDLEAIVPRLLERATQRLGRSPVSLHPEVMKRLERHGWPENLRELTRALQALAAFATRNEITVEIADRVLEELDPVSRASRDRERRERQELLCLLQECGGNFTHMAQRLDVDRGTIKYRLRKYGIIPERRRK